MSIERQSYKLERGGEILPSRIFVRKCGVLCFLPRSRFGQLACLQFGVGTAGEHIGISIKPWSSLHRSWSRVLLHTGLGGSPRVRGHDDKLVVSPCLSSNLCSSCLPGGGLLFWHVRLGFLFLEAFLF